jgi:hypothetical protein
MRPLLEPVRPSKRARVALLSGMKLGPYEIPGWGGRERFIAPVLLTTELPCAFALGQFIGMFGIMPALDRARWWP